jgi:hypothetical protein
VSSRAGTPRIGAVHPSAARTCGRHSEGSAVLSSRVRFETAARACSVGHFTRTNWKKDLRPSSVHQSRRHPEPIHETFVDCFRRTASGRCVKRDYSPCRTLPMCARARAAHRTSGTSIARSSCAHSPAATVRLRVSSACRWHGFGST